MAWVDEFWKTADGNTKKCFPSCNRKPPYKNYKPHISSCELDSATDSRAHVECGESQDMDTHYNGLCGYRNGALPDEYLNEGWWGLVKPSMCLAGKDVLQPRQIYHELQKFWGGDGKAPFKKCDDPSALPLRPHQYQPLCFHDGGGGNATITTVPTAPPGQYLTYVPTHNLCEFPSRSATGCSPDMKKCRADEPWYSPTSGRCHDHQSPDNRYLCCAPPLGPTPVPTTEPPTTPVPSTTPAPSPAHKNSTPSPTAPNGTKPPHPAHTPTPTEVPPAPSSNTSGPTVAPKNETSSGSSGVVVALVASGLALIVAGACLFVYRKRRVRSMTEPLRADASLPYSGVS